MLVNVISALSRLVWVKVVVSSQDRADSFPWCWDGVGRGRKYKDYQGRKDSSIGWNCVGWWWCWEGDLEAVVVSWALRLCSALWQFTQQGS